MKPSAVVLASALALSGLFAVACSSSDDDGGGSGGADPNIKVGPPVAHAPAGSNDPHDPNLEELPDPLAGLPKGAEQLAKVCSRGQSDAVTRGLCSGKSLGSIVDLQNAIGLTFKNRGATAQNGGGGNPAVALLGHSSSLVARDVSAINPRAFVFTPPPGRPARLPGFVVMGFARGEPFVEIVAEDPQRQKLTFYLLRFELGCEGTKSCRAGDLLTPAIEKDWKGWSLYDDEDLKNTIADCRHCHQPGGPSSPKMLRMQELTDPWTHWFHNDRPGGLALLQDFNAAHGDKEDYAGIPAVLLQQMDGRAMEDLVEGQGFVRQPNMFNSAQIEREVRSSSSMQPNANLPRGKSATWQTAYDAAANGNFIPPPYHDVKVTDPDKLAFATQAYKKVLAGAMKPAELPDIRRVFLDDALEEMSMRPRKGATGRQVLVQACAQCHNANLDATISRARFDATRIDQMSASAKQQAIARLKLPASDPKHMPPAQFRTLPDDALAAAIAELSK